MPLAFSTGTSSRFKNKLQKRKFKIKVVVLLHILIPGVMLSSLKTINPWLSACDIMQPSPPEMLGSSCSVGDFTSRTMQYRGEKSCPKPCPLTGSTAGLNCIPYLDETRKNAICNFGSGRNWLMSFLGEMRLRHCCEYRIPDALSGPLLEKVVRGKEECYRTIDSLVDVDNLAGRVFCRFVEILSRFDCSQPYSVRFTCEDCKEAYRRWVCSSLVPFFNGTTRIRPCRSVCQVVEQTCPYFLPENRAPALPTQYAGEPTFLCMDPNIPETGEQLKRSLYPDKDICCVRPCGNPRQGLCIDKGTKCEDLVPYENVTAWECKDFELESSKDQSSDGCPGTYTHPGFQGSAGSPRPLPLVLSVLVGLRASQQQLIFLVLAVVFRQYLCSFGVVHLLA